MSGHELARLSFSTPVRGELLILSALCSLLLAIPRPGSGAEKTETMDAERRAIAFLEREVPLWSKENHCFSCHNNGDGARALLAAKSENRASKEALADTVDWLVHPERWEETQIDPAISGKPLARLQFASALVFAYKTGQVKDDRALRAATARLAEDQSADGSWPVQVDEALGSPVTYGRPLATAMARRTLETSDQKRFTRSLERAEDWLRKLAIENVLDASAVLIGLDANAPTDRAQRQRALDLLRRAQSARGGWGPFVSSASEPFDTAVALVALSGWPEKAETKAFIDRGRDYLVRIQNTDGSWTETTRPPGAVSYAQRLSTTGWATLALLATH